MNQTIANNIVFIDSQVAEYEKLLPSINANTEVVILDSTQDGIEQITNILKERQNITSVQIISHGGEGNIKLGTTYLNGNSIQGYREQLQQWRNALTEKADILLFGCSVGFGKGEAFLKELSLLTGADVAASSDITGNAAFGGNWNLEVATGDIESLAAISPEGLESFTGILPLNVEYFNGKNLGEFRGQGITNNIDINWGSGNPSEVGTNDNFSVRWTGYIYIPQNGEYTFYQTSDDGARLRIGEKLVIDDWKDIANTTDAKIYLEAGLHPIRFDYYENVGNAAAKLEWSSSNIGRQTIPKEYFVQAASNGLIGTYYDDAQRDNDNLSGSRGTQLDSPISFDWGSGKPNKLSGDNDYFGVEWEGYIKFPDEGYYLALKSDDVAQVWINDEQVINSNNSIARASKSFQGWQKIKIRYIEKTGDANINLRWFPESKLFSTSNSVFILGALYINSELVPSSSLRPSKPSDIVASIVPLKTSLTEVESAKFRIELNRAASSDIYYQVKIKNSDGSEQIIEQIALASFNNETSKEITINNNDDKPQNDRTIIVELLPVAGGYQLSNSKSATTTIKDAQLRIGIEKVQDGFEGIRPVGDQVLTSVAKEASYGLFKLNFSQAAPKAFDLQLENPTGTALRGAAANPDPKSDYRLFYRYANDSVDTRNYLNGNKISVKSGDGVGDKQIFVGVEVLNDDILEPVETVSLSLKTDFSVYSIDPTKTSANLNIQDNEPYISISRIVNPSEGYTFGSTIAGLGKALQLERGKTVEIPNSPSLNPSSTNQFSLELWLSVNKLPNGSYSLVGFQDDTLNLSLTAEGYLTASFKAVDANKTQTTISLSSKIDDKSPKLSLNTWSQVAATFDGSTFRLLINGQEVVTKSTTGLKVNSTNSPLILGSSTPNSSFLGAIDEVRLWNTARTQAQIQQNLVTNFEGNETGLVGYWDLDGNTNDATANSNNGILKTIQGLTGQYFNDSKVSNPTVRLTGTPVLTRIDSNINFDWGQSSPSPGVVDVDLFSVRWTGYLLAPKTGTYTFNSTVDDGVRLQVNNQLIIDRWTDNDGSRPDAASLKIFMEEGQLYPINLEFYENKIGARIQLRWSGVDTNNNTFLNNEIILPTHLRAGVDFIENPAPQLGYIELQSTDKNGNPVTIEQDNGLWVRYDIQGGSATRLPLPNTGGDIDTKGLNVDYYNSQFQVSTTNAATRFDGIVIPKGESIGRIYFGAIPDAITEGSEEIKVRILPYNIDEDPKNPNSDQTKKSDRSKYGLLNGVNKVDSLDATVTIQDAQGFQPGLAVYDIKNRLVGLFQNGIYRSFNNLAATNGTVKVQLRLTSQPTASVNLSYGGTTLNWQPQDWETLKSLDLTGVSGSSFNLSPILSSIDSRYQRNNVTLPLAIGIPREDYLVLAEDPRTASQSPVVPEVSVITTGFLVENETNISATVTVRLSDPAPKGGLVISYQVQGGNATLGTDFRVDTNASNVAVAPNSPASSKYQLTIPEGQKTASFTVLPINDTIVEGRETFQIQLLPPDAGQKYQIKSTQNTRTVAIVDDDRAGIELTQASVFSVFDKFTPTSLPGLTVPGTIAFADLDRDQDQDAFVIDDTGKVRFFRNTDSSPKNSDPKFIEQPGQNPFKDVIVQPGSQLIFMDFDRDISPADPSGKYPAGYIKVKVGDTEELVYVPSDRDALFLQPDGTVRFFENVDSSQFKNQPQFVEATDTAKNPFQGINLGINSRLTLTDLDVDGNLDAVVVRADGKVDYYRNTDSSIQRNQPKFELAPDANPFKTIQLAPGSNLTFADIDTDGDADAYSVSDTGAIIQYENTGAIGQPTFTQKTDSAQFTGVTVSAGSQIQFIDLNSDVALDTVVVAPDGKLTYLAQTTKDKPLYDGVLRRVNTSEGGDQVTFGVRLTATPKEEKVVLSFDQIKTSEHRFSQTEFTFTKENWDQYQLVTVTGLDDSRFDGTISYAATLRSVSDDSLYKNVSILLPLVNEDNEQKQTPVVPQPKTDSSLPLVSVTPTSPVSVPESIAISVKPYQQGRIFITSNTSSPLSSYLLTPGTLLEINGGTTFEILEEIAIASNRDQEAKVRLIKGAEITSNVLGSTTATTRVNISLSQALEFPLEVLQNLNGNSLTVRLDRTLDGAPDQYLLKRGSQLQFQGVTAELLADAYLNNTTAGTTLSVKLTQGTTLDQGIKGKVLPIVPVNFAIAGGTPGVTYAPLEKLFASNPAPSLFSNYNRPALGDLNGDGKVDVLFGNKDGTISYGTNISSNSASLNFDLAVNNPFASINRDIEANNPSTRYSSFLDIPKNTVAPKNNSAPTLVDIDKDGDLDAFVGFSDGQIGFYRNTGTATTPEFTLDDSTNPFNQFKVDSPSVAPTFADLDGDGKVDAVIGTRDGLLFYKNTSTEAPDGKVTQLQFQPLSNGLTATYFNTSDFTGDSLFTRVDNNIDWQLALPDSRLASLSDYSVRWQGQLLAPVTGKYTFTLKHDQQASLTINGQSLLSLTEAGQLGQRTAEINLEAGKLYDFQAEYAQGKGNATIQLGWTAKNEQNQTILPFQLIKVDSLQTTNLGNNPFTLISGLKNPLPTFADLDGDGDLDLVLKNADGAEVSYFRNDSLPGQLQFNELTGTDNPLSWLNRGEVAPAFADFNGDNKVDLFLGRTGKNQFDYRVNQRLNQPVGYILPGQTSTTIDLRPLNDQVAQANRDLQVQVLEGGLYRRDTLAAANVTINEDDTPKILFFDAAGQSILNPELNAQGITILNRAILPNLLESDSSQTFQVRLNSQPQQAVTLTLATNNDREGKLKLKDDDETSTSVSLNFTATNWDKLQSFTLVSQDDAIDDGDIKFSVLSTVKTDDPFYSNLPPNRFDVTTIDNDTVGIVANGNLGDRANIIEGVTAALGLKLRSQPTANTTSVRVQVRPINEQMQLNGQNAGQLATLTFDASNWDQEQTVRVNAVDDDVVEGTQLTKLNLSVERTVSYQQFNNLSELKLQGKTKTAIRLGDSVLRLTEKASESGTVFYQDRAAALGVNDYFSSFFRFVINDPSQLARGVSFYISENTETVGLELQFDASTNSLILKTKNTVLKQLSLPKTQDDPNGIALDTRFNNGKVWNVWVDYDGGGDRLELRLSDTLDRPVDTTLIYDGLRSQLTTTKAYLGLSAGSSGETGTVTQDILAWTIDGTDPNYTDVVFPTNNNNTINFREQTPFTVEIRDNDLPTVSIKSGPKALEVKSPSYFTVGLDNVADPFFGNTGVKVNYRLVGGSASNGIDYQKLDSQGVARVAPGELQTNVLVFPIDDFVAEGTDFQITSYDSTTGQLGLKIADRIRLYEGTVLTFGKKDSNEGAVGQVVFTPGSTVLTDADTKLRYIEVVGNATANVLVKVLTGSLPLTQGVTSGVQAAPLAIQSANLQNGLFAEYFNNVNRTGTPAFSRIDSQVNFNFGTGSPGGGLSNDNFGIRWTGFLEAPQSGDYTIYANADDGVRVQIGNTAVIDKLIDEASERSGTITLEGGKRYPIVVDYYERGGGAQMQLSWQSNGINKELIPTKYLTASSNTYSVGLQLGNFELSNGSTLELSGGIKATVTEPRTVDTNGITVKDSKTVDTKGTTVKVTLNPGADASQISTGATASLRSENVTVQLLPGDGYKLNPDATQATLEIADNDLPGVRLIEVGDRTIVREGETAQYQISLLSEPQSPVTIYLTPSPEISIANLNPPLIEAKLINLSADGKTGTLQLRLFQQPTSEKILSFIPQGATDPIRLTFTSNNWEQFQTIENVSLTSPETRRFTAQIKDESNGNTAFTNDLRFQQDSESTFTYLPPAGDKSFYKVTFDATNWYIPQNVTLRGIDNGLVDPNLRNSKIQYAIVTGDPTYAALKLPDQSIGILDRLIDSKALKDGSQQGIEQLQKSLSDVNIPLVGPLGNDATVKRVMEGVTKAISQGLSNTSTAQSIAKAIQDALKSVSQEFNIGGTPLFTSPIVKVMMDSKEVRFAISLGQQFDKSWDFPKNVGLPGLGLEFNRAQLKGSITYDLSLNFGVSKDFGFFIDTDKTGISFSAKFELNPEFQALARLGFFQVAATNLASDPTEIRFDASLKLNDLDNRSTVKFFDVNGDRLLDARPYTYKIVADTKPKDGKPDTYLGEVVTYPLLVQEPFTEINFLGKTSVPLPSPGDDGAPDTLKNIDWNKDNQLKEASYLKREGVYRSQIAFNKVTTYYFDANRNGTLDSDELRTTSSFWFDSTKNQVKEFTLTVKKDTANKNIYYFDANGNGQQEQTEKLTTNQKKTDANNNNTLEGDASFAGEGQYVQGVGLAYFDINGNSRLDVESYTDANNNGKYDNGEAFVDTNKSGKFDNEPYTGSNYDPITVNADAISRFLDVNNDGKQQIIAVVGLSNATDRPDPRIQRFIDGDKDFYYLDFNGDQTFNEDGFLKDIKLVKEPNSPALFLDVNGDGLRNSASEPLDDKNSNGQFDQDEYFLDLNNNSKRDTILPEPILNFGQSVLSFADIDNNGKMKILLDINGNQIQDGNEQTVEALILKAKAQNGTQFQFLDTNTNGQFDTGTEFRVFKTLPLTGNPSKWVLDKNNNGFLDSGEAVLVFQEGIIRQTPGFTNIGTSFKPDLYLDLNNDGEKQDQEKITALATFRTTIDSNGKSTNLGYGDENGDRKFTLEGSTQFFLDKNKDGNFTSNVDRPIIWGRIDTTKLTFGNQPSRLYFDSNRNFIGNDGEYLIFSDGQHIQDLNNNGSVDANEPIVLDDSLIKFDNPVKTTKIIRSINSQNFLDVNDNGTFDSNEFPVVGVLKDVRSLTLKNGFDLSIRKIESSQIKVSSDRFYIDFNNNNQLDTGEELLKDYSPNIVDSNNNKALDAGDTVVLTNFDLVKAESGGTLYLDSNDDAVLRSERQIFLGSNGSAIVDVNNNQIADSDEPVVFQNQDIIFYQAGGKNVASSVRNFLDADGNALPSSGDLPIGVNLDPKGTGSQNFTFASPEATVINRFYDFNRNNIQDANEPLLMNVVSFLDLNGDANYNFNPTLPLASAGDSAKSGNSFLNTLANALQPSSPDPREPKIRVDGFGVSYLDLTYNGVRDLGEPYAQGDGSLAVDPKYIKTYNIVKDSSGKRFLDYNGDGIYSLNSTTTGLNLLRGDFDLDVENTFAVVAADVEGNGISTGRITNTAIVSTYAKLMGLSDQATSLTFLDIGGDGLEVNDIPIRVSDTGERYIDISRDGKLNRIKERDVNGDNRISISERNFIAEPSAQPNADFSNLLNKKYQSSSTTRVKNNQSVKPAFSYSVEPAFYYYDLNNNGQFDAISDVKADVVKGSKLISYADDGSRLTLLELGQRAISGRQPTDNKDLISYELGGSANLGLRLKGQVGTNAAWPSVGTDLIIQIPFPSYTNKNQTKEPQANIALKNVNLDLGSFLTGVIKPWIDKVNQVIDPIRPIIDFLRGDIKLPTRLGIAATFERDGRPGTSILELLEFVAEKIANKNDPDGNANKISRSILSATKWINLISNITDAIKAINTLAQTSNSLIINIGDFNLSNASVTNKDPQAAVDKASAQSQPTSTNIVGGTLQDKARAGTKDTSFLDKLLTAINSISSIPGLKIPVLSDFNVPVRLLMGEKGVDLITFTPPNLEVAAGVNVPLLSYAVAGVNLVGAIGIKADLSFGLDTYGANEWIADGAKASEIYKLFDGLYIGDVRDGVDIPEVVIAATAALQGFLNAGVGDLNVTGGVLGTVNIDLVDEGEDNGTSDGKIRFSDIIAKVKRAYQGASGEDIATRLATGLTGFLDQLFKASGTVDAFAKIDIGVGAFGVRTSVYSKEFAKLRLFEFAVGGGKSASGRSIQSYLQGATVFWDANFNGVWDRDQDNSEPGAMTNDDGSYDFEISDSFDLNGNGQLDYSEGQLVAIDGTDDVSGSPLSIPLYGFIDDSSFSPLTTLAVALLDGSILEDKAPISRLRVEEYLKMALGLPEEIDFGDSDPIGELPDDALLSIDDADGLTFFNEDVLAYQAHLQVTTVLSVINEFLIGLSDNQSVPDDAIRMVAEVLLETGQAGQTVNLTDSTQLKNLLTTPLTDLINEEFSISLSPDELDQKINAALDLAASGSTLNAIGQFFSQYRTDLTSVIKEFRGTVENGQFKEALTHGLDYPAFFSHLFNNYSDFRQALEQYFSDNPDNNALVISLGEQLDQGLIEDSDTSDFTDIIGSALASDEADSSLSTTSDLSPEKIQAIAKDLEQVMAEVMFGQFLDRTSTRKAYAETSLPNDARQIGSGEQSLYAHSVLTTLDAIGSTAVELDLAQSFTDLQGRDISIKVQQLLDDGTEQDLSADFTFDPLTNRLKVTPSPDNAKIYQLTVTATTDNGEESFTDLRLRVIYTDLDQNEIAENTPVTDPAGTLIGNLNISSSTNFTQLQLVSGEGSEDNGLFAITGNELRLKAIPDYETQKQYRVRVQGQDANGQESFQTGFVVNVSDVNEAPKVNQAIADQNATTEKIFSFTFDSNTFSDVDAGDSLTYSATLKDGTNLPAWLKFNSVNRTFSGIPTKSDIGSFAIDVKATDNSGIAATDTFLLSVEQGNVSPTSQLVKIADDIFKITSSSGKSKLQVTLTGQSSNNVNELGVFTVDDAQGRINSIAPGEAGYTQAALERSQVILSAIANLPNGFSASNLSHLLEFNSGDNLRFYLVRNSTTDAVRTGVTPITDILFSDPLTQKITDLGNNNFSLAWKDGFGNNAADFNNLIVELNTTNDSLPLGTNLQGKPQGEVIDLRGVTSQVKVDFVVNREAAFNNYIGFYQVTDENGGIDTNADGKADILTGQVGYTEAAIRRRVAGIDLTVNNQGTATYTGIFQPGSIFAPFIIANASPDALLDSNLNNDPAVYFSFLGANTDKVDHIRLLGNNVFGFEDLANGGDKDFNDVIVGVKLSIV